MLWVFAVNTQKEKLMQIEYKIIHVVLMLFCLFHHLNTALSSADVVREVKPSIYGDLQEKAHILKYLI
jgi:hypothetical protein